MAESAPGSVEALSRAFGFGNDTGAFRKRVEQGGLQLDAEKARAFAKELSKVANEGGALEKVTQKTNAQMQRFFNSLTKAKVTIFEGGMDKGLSYLFGQLGTVVEDLAPLAKAFGAAFSGMARVVTDGIRLMTAPFILFGQALKGLGLDDEAGGMIWKLVGAGGVLALLLSKIHLITKAVYGMNAAFLATLRIVTTLIGPLLILEDVATALSGGNSVSGLKPLGQNKSSDWIQSVTPNFMLRMLDRSIASSNQKVTIELKGEELQKIMTAKIEERKEASTANLASQLEN